MPWWSVGIEGSKAGPFPSSKSGFEEACLTISGVEPYITMAGWHHEGFTPEMGEVVSILGVVGEPPPRDSLPIDLFPLQGSTFSRTQLTWMRSSFFGTVYRTKLRIKDLLASPRPVHLR